MSLVNNDKLGKVMANRLPNRTDIFATLISQLIFWAGVLRHIQLPGLYYDALNPDYIAAETLNSQLDNPGGPLPTAWFPLLGNVYHGVQNYYIGLPIFWFFGMNIVSVRLAQALPGAFTVFLLYLVSVRLTQNRLVALIAAVGLATDIAFLASFRTQFYIILGGEAWLFGSLFFLGLNGPPSNRAGLKCFLSGVCFGLAVYGYFVFLFFLPAMAWLIVRDRGLCAWPSVKTWAAGFIVGMLPYVIGYISLAVAFGEVGQVIEWLSGAVTGIAPLSSKQTIIDRFANAFGLLTNALNNVGNESMIFDESFVEGYAKTKIFIMYTLISAGIVLVLADLKQQGRGSIARQMVALPLSYFFVAALLGDRLWIHHYSALVPAIYLVCGIVVNELYRLIPAKAIAEKPVLYESPLIVLGILLACLNIQQQQSFFQCLEYTGGVGKSSSAMTLMAEEALTTPDKGVYFFPEWGFFPSFNLLTGNRIAFELDLNAANLHKHWEAKRPIRLLFWKESDGEKYVSALKQEGIEGVAWRVYYQRDGKPAFYMISTHYPAVR